MFSRNRRRFAPIALLISATIALAGCFSVESNIAIHDDGTADIELVTQIDTEQLGKFAEMFGEDASELEGMSGDDILNEFTADDDPCGDLTESFGQYETSVEEINTDSAVGVRCKASGVPIAELNSIGEDSSFTIEQDDAGTRFSAVLEGVDELTADSDELTGMLDLKLEDIFSIVFTVTAPGSLGDNNATSTDGAKATWDITPTSDFVTGGDATMTAEWSGSGSGSDSNTMLIALLVAALVIIAIVVAVLVMRRRGSSPSSPTGDEAALDGPPTSVPPVTPAPPSAGDTAPPSSPTPPPPPPPPSA